MKRVSRTQMLVWTSALVAAALASSCSTENPGVEVTSGPTGGTGGAEPGGAGGMGGAAGSGGSAGDAGSGRTDAGTRDSGATSASGRGFVHVANFGSGSSGFARFTPDALPAGCSLVTVMGCEVTTCQPSSLSLVSQSAGAISVTSPRLVAPLNIDYSGDRYSLAISQSPAFVPGDIVTATAAGGTVPVFSKSAAAPSDINVTNPLPASIAIPRSADLAVSWTGGGVGVVEVSLSSQNDAAQKTVNAVCLFPAAGGTGSIPAAVLGRVDKADGSAIRGLLSFAPQSLNTFVVGDHEVTLRVLGTRISRSVTHTD